MIAGATTFAGGIIVYVFGSIRASRTIHERFTAVIIRTNMRFLDSTPVGRIVSRFTRDINAVDRPLSLYLQHVCNISASLAFKLAIIMYLTPIFLIPSILCAVVGAFIGHLYIIAQLSVKR